MKLSVRVGRPGIAGYGVTLRVVWHKFFTAGITKTAIIGFVELQLPHCQVSQCVWNLKQILITVDGARVIGLDVICFFMESMEDVDVPSCICIFNFFYVQLYLYTSDI